MCRLEHGPLSVGSLCKGDVASVLLSICKGKPTSAVGGAEPADRASTTSVVCCLANLVFVAMFI